MAEHPDYPLNTFCWNELATSDAGAAKKFYTELFGWKLTEGDVTPMVYSEIVAGERHIGGIYQKREEQAGMPSQWMAYVAVEDVDASARRVEELGGKLHMPPCDIPKVGRFCIIADPTGATLAMITLNDPHS